MIEICIILGNPMMQYNNSAQNNSNNSMVSGGQHPSGGQQMTHHQQPAPHIDHNKALESPGPLKRPLDSGPTPNNSKKANLDIDSSLDSIVSKIKEEHCTSDVKYNIPPSSDTAASSIKKEVNDTKIDSNAKLKSESDKLPPVKMEDDPLKVKEDPDTLKQEDNLGELDLKDFDGFDGMNNDAFQDLMDDLPEFDKTFYESLDFDPKEEPELDDKSWQDDLNAQSTIPSIKSDDSKLQPATSGPPAVSQPNATEALKMMAQQHQNPPVCDSNSTSMPPRPTLSEQQQQQQPTNQMSRPSMPPGGGVGPPSSNGMSQNMGGMPLSSANGMPTGPGGVPSMNGPSHMSPSGHPGGPMPSSVPGSMPMSGPPMPGSMVGPGMGAPNQDMLKAKMEEEARLRAQVHQSKFRMGNPNGMSNPGMGGPMMGGQYGNQQQAMMRAGNPAMYGMNPQMQVRII